MNGRSGSRALQRDDEIGACVALGRRARRRAPRLRRGRAPAIHPRRSSSRVMPTPSPVLPCAARSNSSRRMRGRAASPSGRCGGQRGHVTGFTQARSGSSASSMTTAADQVGDARNVTMLAECRQAVDDGRHRGRLHEGGGADLHGGRAGEHVFGRVLGRGNAAAADHRQSSPPCAH